MVATDEMIKYLAYKTLLNKVVEDRNFKVDNKPVLVDDVMAIILDEPKFCYRLLKDIPEYFNNSRKIALLNSLFNNVELLSNYILTTSIPQYLLAIIVKKILSDNKYNSLLMETINIIDSIPKSKQEDFLKKCKLTIDEKERLDSIYLIKELQGGSVE